MARRALAVLVAAALPAAPALALDCSQGGTTQFEMDACAGRALASSDEKLNAEYRVILGCVREGPGTQQPFVEAQRAWLGFRDAECRFQAAPSAGGSVQPMVVSLCRKALTDDRLKQFHYYLSCQEGDVSCPLPPGCAKAALAKDAPPAR